MKNKASVFLKQIITLLTSIAKSKSMAIKSKTSAAKARLVMFSLVKNKKVLMDTVSHKIQALLGHDHHRDNQDYDDDDVRGGDRSRARLVMFSLVKNKKVLMDTVSHKIQALLGHDHHRDNQDYDDDDVHGGDRSRALVLYNECSHPGTSYNAIAPYEDEDEDDKYPDLRHSLFDENENFDDVKDGGSVIDIVRNSKVEGEDFKLEDEIDQVADLFINRFHKQIRMQKVLSFKRHQACSREALQTDESD